MYIIFFENIGHKYDFEGGWGGGGPALREQNLFYQINSYLLTM